MPLNNFGYIHPELARGGQPDAKGFEDLRALGFDTTYKLNPSFGSASFPRDEEAKLFAPGQVVEDAYPSTVVLIPKPAMVRRSIIQLLGLLQGGRKVYVHCTHGRDRTGLIVAAFRLIVDRWTLAQVHEERARYGVLGLIEWADEGIWRALLVLAAQEGIALE